MFSARMRLGGTEYSKEKKVEKLIKDLQLTSCKDTYIGSTLVKGISGGERKRACIGVELVADPTVIILDGLILFSHRTNFWIGLLYSIYNHSNLKGTGEKIKEVYYIHNSFAKL
jgi:ABC transporter